MRLGLEKEKGGGTWSETPAPLGAAGDDNGTAGGMGGGANLVVAPTVEANVLIVVGVVVTTAVMVTLSAGLCW